MSEESEHDRVLFGQETDDEDEDNKADHEVEDPGDEDDPEEEGDQNDEISDEPKLKKFKPDPPNKRILKLMDQAKKTGKMIKAAHESGKVAYDDRKSDKRIKKTKLPPSRPKFLLGAQPSFGTEAILVNDDDLKKRVVEKGKEHKIQREIGVKQTRYLPFFTNSSRDVDGFYKKGTHLACIWCTEAFDTIPIPMAYSYSRSKEVFTVGGQYCSFQCMIAKAMQERRKPICAHMMKSVYKIPFAAQEFYRPAPDPMLLDKFGGPMTIDEFRGTLEIPNIKHRKIQLPFIPLSAGLEEIQSMTSTIYEYGDEEKVKRVVKASIIHSNPIHHTNVGQGKVQKAKFAHMPTLQEQILQSERKLRLQRKPEEDTKKKKKRTLRDFMSISNKS